MEPKEPGMVIMKIGLQHPKIILMPSDIQENNSRKEIPMKTRTQAFAGIVMMATFAATGLAMAGGTQNPKENAAQDRRINYLESIAGSKKELTAISTGVDALMKTVKEAKTSDDKTKMKAALEASEKHLAQMKTHTMSCMQHMDAMEKEMSKDSHMVGMKEE
jgi:hypothetical protein